MKPQNKKEEGGRGKQQKEELYKLEKSRGETGEGKLVQRIGVNIDEQAS